MLDTDAFLLRLQEFLSGLSFSCRDVHSDASLSKQACWLRFIDKGSSCCDFCSAGATSPFRLSEQKWHPPILFEESYLSKKMYLWAKIHREDQFSWTLATTIEDDFWQLWSLLTLRTIHITADIDRRGLCGFLTTEELQMFVRILAEIELPTDEDDIEDLDMFGSEEEFSNLQYLLEYSKRCIDKGLGLAWVHDFL